ncbi:MAG: BrnT family toxin [Spirochaetes bacterium]|nr:BrnT family toxin [Spirochaetota bacterium]
MEFDWDDAKNTVNIRKHGVSFSLAQEAFYDSYRIITFDRKHSTVSEKRYFCFGRVDTRILTVRFTIRHGTIRIIGAGFWREGKVLYEKQNRISKSPENYFEGN